MLQVKVSGVKKDRRRSSLAGALRSLELRDGGAGGMGGAGADFDIDAADAALASAMAEASVMSAVTAGGAGGGNAAGSVSGGGFSGSGPGGAPLPSPPRAPALHHLDPKKDRELWAERRTFYEHRRRAKVGRTPLSPLVFVLSFSPTTGPRARVQWRRDTACPRRDGDQKESVAGVCAVDRVKTKHRFASCARGATRASQRIVVLPPTSRIDRRPCSAAARRRART